jgi:uncharacterized glyoxalase superfamily protein PhnB
MGAPPPPHRALSFTQKKYAPAPFSDALYGELETGETTLAFVSHTLGASNFPAGYVRASDSEQPLGMEIALATDDVAQAHRAAIAAGATELMAPTVKPWGQTVSFVRCPAGTLIELCTPMT